MRSATPPRRWPRPPTTPRKATAQAALDAVNADAGMIFKWGALDFAGGTVVHINAGIAGLVGCLMLGKRIGYGRDLLAPHSLTMTTIGASLLWVGWFGFNAGSNLESNGTTALVMINTFVATAAAALSWLFVEWLLKGKPSLLGMLSGAIAGLVASPRPSGFAGPMGGIVLGLVAGAVCFIMCSTVKNAIGYDDLLDVFGVHCIGGILGALATGILVHPDLGGVGIPDYASKPGELAVGAYDMTRCGHRAGQGRRLHDPVVGHRLSDPVQARRSDHRPARDPGRGARRPRHRRPRRARLQLLSPVDASAVRDSRKAPVPATGAFRVSPSPVLAPPGGPGPPAAAAHPAFVQTVLLGRIDGDDNAWIPKGRRQGRRVA